MDGRVERLLEWAHNGRAAPFSIEFHPTNLCNLNCIMCGTRAEHRKLKCSNPDFNPERDAKFELTVDEGKKIVKESSRLGVKQWLITGGGEPFFRKERTLSIMEEIKSQKMFGNLNTNGALLTDEDITRIINMRWDMLMFSIDSHIKEDHNYIRGVPGTFEKSVRNLKRFKSKKKLPNEPKIVFNTLLSNKIYNRIDEFIDFAADTGCVDITFIPLISFDNNSRSLALDDDQREAFQDSIDRYLSSAEDAGIHTNLYALKETRVKQTDNMKEVILKDIKKQDSSSRSFADTACFEPFLNLVIRMNGLVSPCCMLENYSLTLRDNSLEEVWFGDYFSRLRKTMINHKLEKGCSTCVFSQVTHNKELRDVLRKHL